MELNFTLNINKYRPQLVEGLESLDLEGIVKYIKNGHAKKVIICAGAGLSTGAGIPDFRTPGTGLYDNLQKYNLPYPEAIFDISYFPDHPEAFFTLAAEMIPGKFKPTPAHYIARLFNDHGILLRMLTQNIDGLERETALPLDKLVEAHGTFSTAHCLKCRHEYDYREYVENLKNGEIIHCFQEHCDGLVKPDIVFFGESLPQSFFNSFVNDFQNCDLLIVIGTSLTVAPFSSVIYKVPKNCPRLLINRELVGTYQEELAYVSQEDKLIDISPNASSGLLKCNHVLNTRDIWLGGDIQENVAKLIEALGWAQEWKDLQKH